MQVGIKHESLFSFPLQGDSQREKAQTEEGDRLPSRPVHHGLPDAALWDPRPALDVCCHRPHRVTYHQSQCDVTDRRPRSQASAGPHQGPEDDQLLCQSRHWSVFLAFHFVLLTHYFALS